MLYDAQSYRKGSDSVIILVFDQGKLSDSHKETLAQSCPGSTLVYCGDAASPEQLREADVILGNPAPSLLRDCGQLRFLQLFSAGFDPYIGKLGEGARLANATGAYGLAIGEHLLAMLLMLLKKLHLYHINQRSGLWRDEGPVTSIQGATVLVVGLGDIGGAFARHIRAMGGHVVGVRRSVGDKPDYVDELHSVERLDRLLPKADAVALCLPGSAATTGLMSRARLALMKPGAILLNVGRGAAIDQDALVDALRSGRLGGAAVDVTDPEPLPSDHSLWSAPNMLLTPHISGGDHLPQTYDRIMEIAAGNVRAFLSGGAIHNEIDPSTGERARG